MVHNAPVFAMGKDERAQADRFKEAARQIGTDDDEARFNERLKQIAKQKPKDEKKSDD